MTRVTLGEVTENFDSLRKPVKSTERASGRYPYFGASGVVDYVDQYLFDGAYLLIAEDGENLRSRNTPVAFLASGKFWVNNHAHIVRANHLADSRFLAHVLSVTDISGYLSGSTLPKLTQRAMNSIMLDLPPLPTQRAIAAVLGALDDKIAANVRLQDSSRALRAASLGWALGRGSVSVPIGEATALLGRGKAPKYTETYGGVWVINQKCVRSGVVSVEQARLAEAMKEPQLQVGDTLVNSTGQGTLGRVGVWREDVGAFPDSHVTLVRFDPGKVDPWVGAEAVLAAESAIEALGEGSTGQTELSRKALTELQIELPAAGLHGGLGERLRQLHLREHQAANESRHLVTLRDTLLPHLMSGRLTVREAEKQVEAAL